jgi:hypothetical protein
LVVTEATVATADSELPVAMAATAGPVSPLSSAKRLLVATAATAVTRARGLWESGVMAATAAMP